MDMNAIPATGSRLATIRHRAASGTGGAAKEQAQRATRNRGESRESFGFDSKTQMNRVERDRGSHIIDHVPHRRCCLLHFTSPHYQ